MCLVNIELLLLFPRVCLFYTLTIFFVILPVIPSMYAIKRDPLPLPAILVHGHL